MAATSFSSRSLRRAPMTTFAPRSASSLAAASPMPLEAPVMATTFPSIVLMISVLRSRLVCVCEENGWVPNGSMTIGGIEL